MLQIVLLLNRKEEFGILSQILIVSGPGCKLRSRNGNMSVSQIDYLAIIALLLK